MADLITRPLTRRAVHLRLVPRPSNLGESREIMRLISQFGELDYFKSLKYEYFPAPWSALAIFKTDEAARTCLKKSPIRFRMGKAPTKEQKAKDEEEQQRAEAEQRGAAAETEQSEQPVPRGPLSTPFGIPSPSPSAAQTRSLSTHASAFPSPPQPTNAPPSDPTPNNDPTDSPRLFQLLAQPSKRAFRDVIQTGQYHGHFKLDSKQSGQGDLAKRVPHAGLSCVDWRAIERPWRIVTKERDAEEPRRGWGTLGELWESGREEREKKEEWGRFKAAKFRERSASRAGGDEEWLAGLGR